MEETLKAKMPGSGMTVFQRYRLERVIGRGGMGVVWLAHDLKLERPVAMKFLPSLVGIDPAAVKELKLETRRGLELSHPHIVRIYDFVDDEEAAAISMEYIDGKTLSELRLTEPNGVFTVEAVSRWLLGVCEALDYAHFQRKVVHRDLKPANIMITGRDGVAKIADFGIARSLSDTMSRLSAAHLSTSGTLPYMSPQQAMGERPLPTDDVYSLGATLYELLSGKPPFYRGDLPTQIHSKIPPTILERRRELEIPGPEAIPKVWEEAIAACLHKEPHMRPACAGALAEMLGLKPATVHVRTASQFLPPSANAPASEHTRRGPWVIAGTLAGLALAVAAWQLSQPKPAASGTAATRPGTAPGKAAAQPKTAASPAPAPAAPAGKVPATGGPPAVKTPATPPPVAGATPPAPQPVTPAPAPPPAPATVRGPTPAALGPASTAVAVAPPAAAPADFVGPPAPASAEAASMPPGPMPLVPDAGIARLGALAAATPSPALAPLPPLPPGSQVPAGSVLMSQPPVSDPPKGYWEIGQVFPVIPHANYSEKGKRYLLYRTQQTLKEQGLYTAKTDGEEGRSTHNAIILFQAKNGLQPNGLLDLPTLAALQLSAEPDKSDWSPPAGSVYSGTRRRSAPKEEPNFLQRTSETLRRLNPFNK